MARIVKVYIVDLRGRPLLCDIEEDELEPYRRNLAGFRMERGHGKVDWGRNERPPVDVHEEDSEGDGFDGEAPEGPEGES